MRTETVNMEASMGEQEPLPPGYSAFVIYCRASNDVEHGRFEGRVAHVASGEVGQFETPEQLAGLIRRMLTGRCDQR